jgi:hypothetical protein
VAYKLSLSGHTNSITPAGISVKIGQVFTRNFFLNKRALKKDFCETEGMCGKNIVFRVKQFKEITV